MSSSAKILDVQVLNVSWVGDGAPTLVGIAVEILELLVSATARIFSRGREDPRSNIKSGAGKFINKILTLRDADASEGLPAPESSAPKRSRSCASCSSVSSCELRMMDNCSTAVRRPSKYGRAAPYPGQTSVRRRNDINLYQWVTQNLAKRKRTRNTSSTKARSMDAKVRLLSLLIEIVQNNLWYSVTLEVQNNSMPLRLDSSRMSEMLFTFSLTFPEQSS